MKLRNRTFIILFSGLLLLLPTGLQSSFSQSQDLQSQTIQSNNNYTTKVGTSNTVVDDSQTILLEGTSMSEGSYLYLYDSSPYKIINSHIAAKIPCNENLSTDIIFLFGPDLDVPLAGLDLEPQLSVGGELCMYRGDIVANETSTITDIAIYNNSTEPINFPPTSTVIIGVYEIAPIGNNTLSQ